MQETTAAGGEKTPDTGGVHELPISEAKPNELPALDAKHGNVAETYELHRKRSETIPMEQETLWSRSELEG